MAMQTMESISPNIFVEDIDKTIAFYRALDFELVMTVPETAPFNWAMMTCGSVAFMFQTFESLGSELQEIKRENGGSLLFYIKTKGIRAFYEKVKNGGSVVKGLEKTFYGATEFSLVDNNGYLLTFAEDE